MSEMLHDAGLCDALVRGTAWLSFAAYILTLIGWTRGVGQKPLRWLWTLAWLIFVVHVSLAFDLVHHWSHWEAREATRVQGDYGDGVYLNYLVVVVWLLDVGWWWYRPYRYWTRSKWLTRLLHGFLFFMWFNAAVIFAKGYMPMVGGVGFVVLALAWAWFGRRR